jgi:hypothetical protein
MKNKFLLPTHTYYRHALDVHMLVSFNKFFLFLLLQLFLLFFYNISYAGRTVNIDFKIPDSTSVAANGNDSNNYSPPFHLDSNDNILNLNVTPGTACFICSGAGQGNDFDNNHPTTLLGDVRNNTLNINCNVEGGCFLSGGMTSTGTVSSNTVNIYAVGSSTEAVVCGGALFGSGSAENNIVNIYPDFSCDSVYGGAGAASTSSFNTVNVFSKLNISRSIFGGGGENDSLCMNNIVNVHGSVTIQSAAILNSAKIGGGYVDGNGSAHSNSVNISGNIQSGGDLDIYGGYVRRDGTAHSNSVNISGNIQSERDLDIYGGYVNGDGTAHSNSVNISGDIRSDGTIDIIGGKGDNTDFNIVTISGNIQSGGYLDIYGGYVDGDGTAHSNSVNISGDIRSDGNIDIIGGEGDNTDFNIVTISGKIVSRNGIVKIIGGSASKIGNNGNNGVRIYETAEISTNTVLYGVENLSGNQDLVFSGNHLEIVLNKKFQVETVGNFQDYKLTLLEGIRSGETIFSFRDSDGNGAPFDVNGIDITIPLSPKSYLNVGDTVVIHCDKGFTSGGGGGSVSSSTLEGVYTGLVVECRSKFDLGLDMSSDENIVATLSSKKISARAEAKSCSQGVCRALTFTNQGADIIAREGMGEVRILSGKLAAFGAVSYGNSKYGRGCIDVKGYGVIGGVGKRLGNKQESISKVYGIIFEYGNGEYTAEDMFPSGRVKARGDNEYIGVGILGNIEFEEEGLYVNGSVRGGRSKVDYKTLDIWVTEAVRKEVKFNFPVIYVGAHMECGYGFKVDKNITVAGFGRCTYTWQGGKEIELATKEKIQFYGANSNRIRIGVKGQYEGKGIVKLYIVVGGEQELSGEIKAKAEEQAIANVKLEGLTWIEEVGVNMDISEKLRITVAGEGFFGKREGLSGMLRLKYAI